jgi:hypothetical protein
VKGGRHDQCPAAAARAQRQAEMLERRGVQLSD